MTAPVLRKRLPRRPSTAALIGAGLLLLALALIPLSVLARQPGYPVQPIVIALAAGVVGTLVARHQPRNACGWLLLAIAAASLLSTGAGAYSLLVYRLGRQLPLGPAGLVLYQLWSPGLLLLFLVILLFPDGRVPSGRWRPALWAYCLLCAGYLGLLIGVAANAIGGNRIHVDAYGGLTVVDYPSGFFAIIQNILLALTLALGLSFACYQVLAWRRATGDRAQQLKWLTFGSAICIACTALSVPGYTSNGIWAVLNDVLSLGFVALPASIGVGIMRYRLYEIDRLISRTVAYAIVTGLLLGVYAAVVALARYLVTASSPVENVAATLAAVVLFDPLRRRVQRVVDRRFRRARQEAEAVIAAFAARMQTADDLDEVRRDLLAVAYRIVEPRQASVWISQP
jgi:hypothetical protein